MDTTKSRILGIAIRASWLGFAAIDECDHLVDWGMIYYQRKNAAMLKAAKRRVEFTITSINPSHVVLLPPESEFYQNLATVRSFTRAVRAAASLKSIPCVSSTRDDVRGAFSDHEARSKDEIAFEIARQFPELAWRLPPKRKTWKKEDSRLALFDAAAAALAFVQISGKASSKVAPSGRPLGDV